MLGISVNVSLFQNELRKKERESDKLKEKIQKVVVEKQSSQKLGMRLLNNTAGQPQMSLHPNFSAKKKMQNISAEQDIYNTIMFKLEEREKTLILENQNLKQTLEAVCSRLHGSMSDEVSERRAGAVYLSL